MKRWKAKSTLPPKKALHGPREHAQQHARKGEHEREQHAHAKAVDQLREQVAPAVVGAQPVVARGRRGVGVLGKVVDGVRAVGIERVDRPVAALREAFADERVEVVGGGFEVAAEDLFRVVAQHGEVELAFIAHEQRPVVADELRSQAQQHQRAKDDQAAVAEPVAPKAPPRAVRGRPARRGVDRGEQPCVGGDGVRAAHGVRCKFSHGCLRPDGSCSCRRCRCAHGARAR
jgi:hypothetical protein